MKDYLLFMDVSGDIDHGYVQDGSVRLLPMDFIIEGKEETYTDDESGMDPLDFYRYVREKKAMSTTQIAPASYVEYFTPYLQQGYSAICLCLSGGLSSSYNSACNAARELKEQFPDVDMLPVDSLRATGTMGIIGERMIENKRNGMTLQQNYDDLTAFRDKVTACAYVDDLDSLKRGGRISRTVAFVGGLMGIKPLLTFNPNGTLSVWGKQHGAKRSIEKMVEFYLQRADVEQHHTVSICHADEENYARELAEKIKAVSPNCEIKIRLLSPIIGVHLGTGAMVLSFVTK